jgi:hypothetical protein
MYTDIGAAFFGFICLPGIALGLWGLWDWLTRSDSKSEDLMFSLGIIAVCGFFAWWIIEDRRP